ncbi:MAG: hypothetical protein ACRD4B_08330, partial [Acidobacteriota bacterium]
MTNTSIAILILSLLYFADVAKGQQNDWTVTIAIKENVVIAGEPVFAEAVATNRSNNPSEFGWG